MMIVVVSVINHHHHPHYYFVPFFCHSCQYHDTQNYPLVGLLWVHLYPPPPPPYDDVILPGSRIMIMILFLEEKIYPLEGLMVLKNDFGGSRGVVWIQDCSCGS